MKIAVGLTTSDLSSLDHGKLNLTLDQSNNGPAAVYRMAAPVSLTGICGPPRGQSICSQIAPGRSFSVVRSGASGALALSAPQSLTLEPGEWLLIAGKGDRTRFSTDSIRRSSAPAVYQGSMAVFASAKGLRVALICDLDEYLRGVLHSEIPGSYHIEAIKCQAVAARTYALRPRIDHGGDCVNVCDSYLCCQYFGGLKASITASHKQAIDATASQVLVYQERPILALFSSCAGGHTEHYESCFSDPFTNQFPPEPLPYLRGVPEAAPKVVSQGFTEDALRKLYSTGKPATVDQWSHHFKWAVTLSGDQIESHLHHNVATMLARPDQAAFLTPPPSGKFGHVRGLTARRRGVSGQIIELAVSTSAGDWLIRKELVIRDLFKVPPIKLARLKSARIFFNCSRDRHGHIASLTVCGLGWGHGVGMQQTGAQGWAKKGLDYKSILTHYFTSVSIETV